VSITSQLYQPFPHTPVRGTRGTAKTVVLLTYSNIVFTSLKTFTLIFGAFAILGCYAK